MEQNIPSAPRLVVKKWFSVPLRFRLSSLVLLCGILLFSCYCSAIRLEIDTIGISFTHLIMPILVLYLILRGDTSAIIRRDSMSLLLLFIWVISIVSTVFNSGLPTRSVTGAINFTSYIILFLLSQWLMKLVAPADLIRTLISTTKLSALVGLFCLILALITQQTNIGATYDHVNQQNFAFIDKPIPSIRSLSIEPNLFGIITGSSFCILIAIYLTYEKRKVMLISIFLLGLALLLSYTRSAYVGIAIAILVMAFVSKQKNVVRTAVRLGSVAIVSLIVVILILPNESSFKQAISYKLGSGMFDFSEGTAVPRMVGVKESLKGFIQSPIIGNGIFSANNEFINPQTHEITGTAGPIGWLNGLFIQALHDTGLLGLLSWIFFFFFILRVNYRIFKILPHSLEKSTILGFLGGNIVILIGSQASSVVWIAFPFVFWAANLTLLRHCKNRIIKQCYENRD
jgi:hypothetical protein